MIYIDVVRNLGKNKMKTYHNSSDFFLSFFRKIDQNHLAQFFVKIHETKYLLDFSYDFLSIYDFLHKTVEYINFRDKHSHHDLLLYERGDSKIEFQNLKNMQTQVTLHIDSNIEQRVFKIEDLNNIILNLIQSVENVVSYFEINPVNLNHIEIWKNRIISKINQI